MIKQETRWLISLLMSLVMTVTLLGTPAVFADDNTGSADKYINSDGEQIDVQTTDDGFVYDETGIDDQEGLRIIGYLGDKDELTVPAKIDGKTVISFDIDPRWPVTDEMYDHVNILHLPATVMHVDPKYMSYFLGLTHITVDTQNDRYYSEEGVLYKVDDRGLSVVCYPAAKDDKEYVMPADMYKMYRFPYDNGIEKITLSKNLSYVDRYDLYPLDSLKEYSVQSGNESYYANDGVLYEINRWTDYEYDPATDDYTKEVEVVDRTLVAYPPQKTDTAYTIPSDVNIIGDPGFNYNNHIKKLVLPSSIERIDSDALYGAEELNTIVFTAKEAPSVERYSRFDGIRDVNEDRDYTLKFEYPKDGTGYEDFIAYLKGKNFNYWDEAPYLESEEIPLYYNRCPVEGYPAYGTAYPVYSSSSTGTYTKNMPDKAGTWYVKLVVDATSDYTGIESEAFSFTVFDYDAEDKPVENYWLRTYGDVEAAIGEAYDIEGTPAYGKVDKILYKEKDAEDIESNWTETKPTKIGVYSYKLVANGTKDYEGTIYISSEDSCWLTITKQIVDLEVGQETIPIGETPKPEYEFRSYVDDTHGVDLKKVYFKIQKYSYDEDTDEETYTDVPGGKPAEPGEYVARACYDSDTVDVDGSAWFEVLDRPDYAEYLINNLGDIRYFDSSDEEYVEKARKAYDSLTKAEKEEVSSSAVEKLEKAEKRIAYVLADEALESAEIDYNEAQQEYEAAKEKADKSKAAAEAAAKTPGAEAVKAAEAAKADADALKAAADKLEKAAEKVEEAAKEAAQKAKEDPVLTRLDWQNAGRYAKTSEENTADAKDEQSSAKKAQEDAASFIDSVSKKTGTSAKKFTVKGFKVKAAKKGKATVTWKVNKKASGYQIKYSLKKNMKKAKTINVKKASVKKATAKKLKKGKKYFFRMRTATKITNAKGKITTVYGKWTKVLKIKAK